MMKRKDSYDVLVAVGTVASWVSGVSFVILVIGAVCVKYDIGGPAMSIWEILLEVVLPAAITGIATTCVTYFRFLKEMPDKIASSLQKGQQLIQENLDPSNAKLSEQHKELHADHEKLRTYLEEAAKQQAVAQANYANLDSNARSIVDEARKLNGLADILQQKEAVIRQQREQIAELQERIVTLEHQIEVTHKHSVSYDRAQQRKREHEIDMDI